MSQSPTLVLDYVPRAHLPLLDGLRGLAIVMVMLYHQTVMTIATPFDATFAALPGLGWVGVDLFFVLSGFLITGILYDAKGSALAARNFYIRRALRIFPLYYAVVFVALVLLPAFPHPWATGFSRVAGDERWYWLYLSNFLIAYHEAFRHAILDVSWSLAIEEQFYLFWPVVVLLLPRRSLLPFCGGLLVGALALRIAMTLAGVSPIPIYVLPFTRMDALAAGALVALLVRGPGGLAALLPAARRLLAGTGAVLVGLGLWQRGFHWDNALVQTLGYSLLALFFAALLTLTLGLEPMSQGGRLLGAAWLRALGRYSYALYLFHLPVRGVLRDLVYGPAQFPSLLGSQLPGQLLFYGLASTITFALAWLSWQLYEQPFLRLKTHFPLAQPGSVPQLGQKTHEQTSNEQAR